jgi:biopolymer transport protein ExbD
MNVTPLIDVLLVLLIIFMVLPLNFGEVAEIPQAKNDATFLPPDGSVVVIQLGDNGFGHAPTLTINHDPVSWDSLENKLQDIYRRRIQRVMFLRGDPEIDFQYVAQVVDMAHHAGVDHVGLLGASE